MKIACLQFSPKIGQVEANIRRAEGVLANGNDVDIDILVLPELAFSGYNFPSFEAIRPFLEVKDTGVTTQWARRTAKRLNCIVAVGYPEISEERPNTRTDASSQPPNGSSVPVVPITGSSPDGKYNYNSAVIVAPDGSIVAHYRKSFLYYTDATWAREGQGFFCGTMELPTQSFIPADSEPRRQNVRMTMGICMDINPYNFTAPWSSYEFANHVLECEAQIVLLSMAWLSHDLVEEMIQGNGALEPDRPTLSYWVARFQPLLERVGGQKVTMVMANRSGVESDACYAGTSTVMRMGDGMVELWDLLGKGEERLLIVDTEQAPNYMLRLQIPDSHDDGSGESEDDEDAS